MVKKIVRFKKRHALDHEKNDNFQENKLSTKKNQPRKKSFRLRER